MYDYDLIAIGGGTAGLTVSRLVAQKGKRVAVVEARRTGGDCLWTGCVPSKSLVEAARAASRVRTAERFGIEAELKGVDFQAVRRHIRSAQERAGEVDTPEAIAANGVELVCGEAKFLDDHAISVDGRRMQARHFVIATGARPSLPPIRGLAEAGVDTTDTLWDWNELPSSVAMIGGGPAGCEIAQALGRLGADVLLLEREGRVLPSEMPDAGDLIGRLLVEDGVSLATGATVDEVTRAGDRLRVTWTREGEPMSRLVSRVVVTSGRRPAVDGLGLDRAGVAVTARGIKVDSRLRTTVPHIFAAGDVTGGPQFTHVAEDQARAIANAVNGGLPGRFGWNGRVVPRVTFTDPEVASVGMAADEARARYGDRAAVWRLPLRSVDRAATSGEVNGFLEVVTAPGWERFIPRLGSKLGGQVVGATFVAPGAGDLLATIVVGMRLRIPAAFLIWNVQPYPTYGLGVRHVLGMAFDATPRAAS